MEEGNETLRLRAVSKDRVVVEECTFFVDQGPGVRIFSVVEPPAEGTRPFDLVFRAEALSGDPIRVLAIAEGKPLAGVQINLRNAEGSVVSTASTDIQGQSLFTAPAVSTPQLFFLSASKEGHANFVQPSDPRAKEAYGSKTGFYPPNTVAVIPYPSLVLAPLPQLFTTVTDFRIDEAVGPFNSVSFSELVEKAKKRGYKQDVNFRVGLDEIDKSLEEMDGEDIYIFFGHSKDTDGDKTTAEGLVGYAITGDPAKLKDALIKSLKADGDPPAIVFLGACSSHALLQDFVDASVKVAVGLTGQCSFAGIEVGLRAFWEALLDGKTLEEALMDANAALTRAGRLFNPDGARFIYKAKDSVKPTMKLDDILGKKE